MAGFGFSSAQFDIYLEQTALIRQETLTTDALPCGGVINSFLLEVLGKVNGGGANTHSVDCFKIVGGVPIAILAGGAFNFSGASDVNPTMIPMAVDLGASGQGNFAVGDEFRIVINGDVTDTSKVRVHFLCSTLADNQTNTVVTSS